MRGIEEAPEVRLNVHEEGDVYEVPEDNLPKLQKRIERMNKVARKLEQPEVELRLGDKHKRSIRLNNFEKYEYWVCDVQVFGAAPSLQGWEFVATLQHGESGKNIIRAVPGYEVPKHYRTVSQGCDYCKKPRSRKDTFIVHNISTKKYQQVGSGCLRDFLGHHNPQLIASYASNLASLPDEMDEYETYTPGSKAEPVVSLEKFMAFVVMEAEKYGWMSRGKAYDEGKTATADYAITSMNIAISKKNADRPTEENTEKAKALINWGIMDLAQGDPAEMSDYIWNLCEVITKDNITWRELGLAASLYVCWYNAMERKAENKRRAEENTSQHIGDIKERLQFDNLKVEFEKSTDGYYGTTILYKFSDEKGNVIIWWSSRWQDFEIGDVVSGKATVKAHDEFNGEYQTVILRAKFKVVEA